MSAFMVNPETIALVAATALSEIPPASRTRKDLAERGATTLLPAFNRTKGRPENDEVSFGELAVSLAGMNMDALRCRYSDADSMFDFRLYTEGAFSSLAHKFRGHPVSPAFSDVPRDRLPEVVSEIDCFLYQCSEGDVPGSNPLFEGCEAFADTLTREFLVTSGPYAVDRGEQVANANLIAAAPDLLASLKELLPMWESGMEEPWVKRARAAVAKAEGETEEFFTKTTKRRTKQ